jgi:hypothetical protein
MVVHGALVQGALRRPRHGRHAKFGACSCQPADSDFGQTKSGVSRSPESTPLAGVGEGGAKPSQAALLSGPSGCGNGKLGTGCSLLSFIDPPLGMLNNAPFVVHVTDRRFGTIINPV